MTQKEIKDELEAVHFVQAAAPCFMGSGHFLVREVIADNEGGRMEHAIVQCGDRTPIPELYIDLPKGSSMGVSIDLNTDGAADCYIAVICHKKNGKDK